MRVLLLYDMTSAKPYARRMGLVTRHWPGKHHAAVSLLWHDGQALAWGIEQYHRSLKQRCGVEKAHVGAALAQRDCTLARQHLVAALRAPHQMHQ